MSETIVTIDRIIHGGDGLGRDPDGRMVFVPRTAPGDVVEVEYTETHRSWRRARALGVVSPGAGRTDPTCAYYDRCGGCQLQHLLYTAQLEAKASVVADCLRRVGKMEAPAVHVNPSVKPLGYRNRVSFAVRHTGSDTRSGFHALHTPDEIVDIAGCPLVENPVNTAWTAVRRALPAMLRAAGTAGTARADARVTLRTTSDRRVGLAIEGLPDGTLQHKRPAGLADVSSIWWTDRRGRVVRFAGDKFLADTWGRYTVPLSGTAFLQVNRGASAVLEQYVISQCTESDPTQIVDAYCGFGLRSLELARGGRSVVGIDINRTSIRAARLLADIHSIKARFEVGAVERALRRYLPADLVVLNPPRCGVAPGLINTLLHVTPPHVIYVSCNPATLARDLQRLAPVFALANCRAFDLFPQTAHVETVATLIRRKL